MTGHDAFLPEVQVRLARLAECGVDALGPLFDLTGDRLFRFAASLARNRQDAEDAVQTALTKLAEHPYRFAQVSFPWAYLIRMVRNEVLVLARRENRCVATADLSDFATYCPVDEAEREESHRAVWSALRTLPPEQAEVVVLKIWEEMTFAQIAETLQISPNTAASRYQYGMAKLSLRLHAFDEARST